MKTIYNFFENFNPNHVFVIITHCDLMKPDPHIINNKIESLKKWGGFEIKKENVILFDNTKESL